MPLTAALQERLKKRGIIKKDEAEKPRAVCPNKSNPYHECSDYCAKKWKETPKGTLILPRDWKKVVDEKTNHPYFWNVKTGEVSWYPPPGSVTSSKKEEDEEKVGERKEGSKLVERPKKEKPRAAPYSKPKRKGYRPPVDDDELDPMDPAAYSDAPRGTWSAGLDRRGEAKTGVDVTANGPLFQMRPYPSPGDILRANRKLTED